jgi:hypothetical protein
VKSTAQAIDFSNANTTIPRQLWMSKKDVFVHHGKSLSQSMALEPNQDPDKATVSSTCVHG